MELEQVILAFEGLLMLEDTTLDPMEDPMGVPNPPWKMMESLMIPKSHLRPKNFGHSFILLELKWSSQSQEGKNYLKCKATRKIPG